MDDAIVNKKPLCASAGGHMPRMYAVYPRVMWGTVSQSQAEPADKLMALDSCEGWVTFALDYKNFRTMPEYCKLELAQVVSPGLGGWATSRSSQCVGAVMSYGLLKLDEAGALSLLIDSYLPQENSCALPPPATAATAARRLEEDISRGVPAHARVSMHEWWNGGKGRRLAATASLNAAADSSGGTDAVPKMEVVDFIGLFAIWFLVSLVAVVGNHMVPKGWYANCYNGAKKLTTCIGASKVVETAEDLFEESAIQVDNEAAMLRKVIKKLQRMQHDVDGVKEKLGVEGGIDDNGQHIVSSTKETAKVVTIEATGVEVVSSQEKGPVEPALASSGVEVVSSQEKGPVEPALASSGVEVASSQEKGPVEPAPASSICKEHDVPPSPPETPPSPQSSGGELELVVEVSPKVRSQHPKRIALDFLAQSAAA